MIELGLLRIATNDGVPFAREKLRTCMVAAGLKRVVAGQIMSILSQDLRRQTPVELRIFLDNDGHDICIQSPILNQKYNRIRLPKPLTEDDLPAIKRILAFLTRDELLHDLENQVEERTAELKKERERSEKLLQNMLPGAIATRMKDGETIADHHEATVVFVDIAGFTAFARDRSASVVVSMLDSIFREFDAITRRHGLEKIKTIGDGYLAAAGLPEHQIDHVDRAVMMGLDIVGVIPRLREELGLSIDVRVGIHTGPVLAGVIGVHKPFYDIWGDTVNVASRLEKNGALGRVHISDDVRQALGGRFHFEDRGPIELKNRGSVNTWFVDWSSARAG